jgi:hypothetical protein
MKRDCRPRKSREDKERSDVSSTRLGVTTSHFRYCLHVKSVSHSG